MHSQVMVVAVAPDDDSSPCQLPHPLDLHSDRDSDTATDDIARYHFSGKM